MDEPTRPRRGLTLEPTRRGDACAHPDAYGTDAVAIEAWPGAQDEPSPAPSDAFAAAFAHVVAAMPDPTVCTCNCHRSRSFRHFKACCAPCAPCHARIRDGRAEEHAARCVAVSR